MVDPAVNSISPGKDDLESKNDEKKKEGEHLDPEFFSCLLQPSSPDSDPNYIGIRRVLLYRKAQAGVLRRKDWRCNGKGYVAYRNYLNRLRNGDSLQTPSRPSTPGQRLIYWLMHQWTMGTISKSTLPKLRGRQLEYKQGRKKFYPGTEPPHKFQF